MEDVKVVNVTVKPVGQSLDQTMQETAQVMDEAMKGFEESAKEKKAKSFLNEFKNYVKGTSFKSDVEEVG